MNKDDINYISISGAPGVVEAELTVSDNCQSGTTFSYDVGCTTVEYKPEEQDPQWMAQIVSDILNEHQLSIERLRVWAAALSIAVFTLFMLTCFLGYNVFECREEVEEITERIEK